jgi:DNA polymerase-3 subunit epsilon
MSKTYLFFDTETTGLPKDYKLHYSVIKNWPQIVQLSWVIYRDNEEISGSDMIIKPANFIISEEVAKLHGISNDIAHAKGYDIKKVLNKFYTDCSLADVVIGHNVSFDRNVIMSEFCRNDKEKFAKIIEDIPYFCTMFSTTKFCEISNGRGGYKWPKLVELYVKLFGEEFENQHNALNDIKATAKCFFELIDRSVIKESQIKWKN